MKRQRIHSPQSLFNEDTVLSILFLHLRDHFLNNKVGKKKRKKKQEQKKPDTTQSRSVGRFQKY